MESERNAIVVYGASSEGIDQKYKDAAYRLGELIAGRGLTLVSGGGKAGLMKAAIEGATSCGGRTVGVLPRFMVDRNWQHPLLTEMITTPDMHSRKRTMASLSRGAVACPGGCGTFEELMEIITWRQLGLYYGQVVILNTSGYYDPLIEMLDRTVKLGFMRSDHTGLWHVAATPEQAVEMVLADGADICFSQKIR